MCADIETIKDTLETFESLSIEYLHIDIMDGHFVPNFMLGTDYCKHVKRLCSIPLDIHLMIEKPEEKISWFDFGKGDIVSVHAESTAHLQKALAEIRNLCKGVLQVYFLALSCAGLSDYPDITAADGFHPDCADLPLIQEGCQIQCVGVHSLGKLLGEDDFRPVFAKSVAQHPVGAVADTGLAQGAVQCDYKMICLGVAVQEELGSPLRPHGVGRGRPLADLIDLPNGFHDSTSDIRFLQYTKLQVGLQLLSQK